VSTHLRKQKNCLNCGAEVTDRYCSHCGQENLVPKDTVFHLVQHFVSDIVHYDSKFLTTIRDLLFKPGFLTLEYLNGKRIRYLNPVRMYIFISFLFFIVLFAQRNAEDHSVKNNPAFQNLNLAKQLLADSLKKTVNPGKTVSSEMRIRDSIVSAIASKLDTTIQPVNKEESIGFSVGARGFLFTLEENRYNSIHEYDSVQHSLPDSLKNNFMGGLFIRKNISIKNRLGNRSQITVNEEFQHNVPKLMFILLPVFALLLFLFFRRREHNYAAHIIFAIHYHSFAFLVLLATNLLSTIIPSFAVGLTILGIGLMILILYLVMALKKVYGQSLFISILKGMAVSILYILMLILSLLLWAIGIFFTA
jgi:Protein of unknown function (DUF3667)